MNQKEFEQVLAELSERRKEVLQKVLNRENNDEIAKSLTITPATVRKHVEEICDKFGIPRETSGKRYPRRNDLIALFAKYKPELFQGDTLEVLPSSKVDVEETKSDNSDFMGGESMIADSALEDIEILVQNVRSHFDTIIQDECETLCTFNLLYTPMQGNLSRLYVQTKLYESQPFVGGDFSEERQLWNEVVRKNPKLMVLGKPGVGKTTLLQYIAVHCDELYLQPKLIPVFVSLKTLAENSRQADEVDLLGYIQKKYCRNYVSESEFKTLLGHGRLLFLLDGLDEIIENKLGTVIQKIHNLVDDYGENSFIVSCRKEFQAYQSKKFGRFNFCKVAEFEEQQTEEFIKNWFDEATVNAPNEQSSQATQLIDKLRLPENQRIRELADTPLLLHLICLIFQHRGDLPFRRVDLYKEAIDLLLEKWNQFNERTQIYISDINLVEIRKALRQLSAINFEQGKSSFEEGEIIQFIEEGYQTLFNIEILSGLLIKKQWKTYTFSHQTLQEYLTAEEFVNSRQGWQILITRIAEQRWREVFLLTVELFPNTEDFLQSIEQGFQNLPKPDEGELDDAESWNQSNPLKTINSDWKTPSLINLNLQRFLKQATQKAYAVTSQCKPIAIRAFYLGCVIMLNEFVANREFILGSERYVIEYFRDLSSDIDCNFSSLLSYKYNQKSDIVLDYLLMVAFDTVSELVYWRRYLTDRYYSLTYELNSTLDATIEYCSANYYKTKQLCLWVEEEQETNTDVVIDLPYELIQNLRSLREELPLYREQELENMKSWWWSNGGRWLEKLRNLIIEYRHMGHKQLFDYYEFLDVIEPYYQANIMLWECLNSDCEVPEELRSRIEDNLFMPLYSSPIER